MATRPAAIATAIAAAEPPPGAGSPSASLSRKSRSEESRRSLKLQGFWALRALDGAEALSKRFDERGLRLVAGAFERLLEIGQERRTERLVGAGPLDDLVEAPPRKRDLLRRPDPRLGRGGQGAQELGQCFLVVFGHTSSTTRLCRDRFSSLQLGAKFDQTAGNAAGNRARRQIERLADQAVALVPGEEAVEDLPAVPWKRRERIVHRERLVEPRNRVVDPGRLLDGLLAGVLARAGPERVHAEPPRELRQPGTDRLVVAQLVQMLIGARED